MTHWHVDDIKQSASSYLDVCKQRDWPCSAQRLVVVEFRGCQWHDAQHLVERFPQRPKPLPTAGHARAGKRVAALVLKQLRLLCQRLAEQRQ